MHVKYQIMQINGTNMVEHTAPLPLQEAGWLMVGCLHSQHILESVDRRGVLPGGVELV